MAVVVQYIVVRNGVEKMTFTTKKEADAYDKMLDIADALFEFVGASDLEVDESTLEELSLFLAKNKDDAISILRGIKPRKESDLPTASSVPSTAVKKTASGKKGAKKSS